MLDPPGLQDLRRALYRVRERDLQRRGILLRGPRYTAQTATASCGENAPDPMATSCCQGMLDYYVAHRQEILTCATAVLPCVTLATLCPPLAPLLDPGCGGSG